jgi:glycosyltransferase involved in cell wall biosynthesis
MIEAMACGTPVVAWRCGSVPEIIDEGLTGFVVASEDEAVAAVEQAASLDRHAIRAVFERRFTSAVMARNYVRLYRQLAGIAEPSRSNGLGLGIRLPTANVGDPVFAE